SDPAQTPAQAATDVNECEETNGGCEALCCNTIGSFYCRCPPGQKLNEDGKTCQGQCGV
uniref:EGF-like calcium-binding domain-containing protein n=1 Tax=Haplochromis burtoni TaxID=8153 RepID=A0A3Q3C590_HAPBU